MEHTTTKMLLASAAARAADFLEGLPARPVGESEDAAHLRSRFLARLPGGAIAPSEAIAELAAAVEPGLVASAGPRYFGYVIGGSTPASLAADWLTSAWDQNAQTFATSPAASIVEEVVAGWLVDLLGLPEGTSTGFVTGCQMANFTALAVARNTVLARAGWDVAAQGLGQAPAIRVLLSEEAHATVKNALYLLGIGTSQVTTLAADAQGRMKLDALDAALSETTGPVIVSAQAGNVNTGAFEPFAEIARRLEGRNGWMHIDGAFGLWAAASAATSALMRGAERADSWATDAHKWLNVPYDSGLVFVRDAAAHRGFKTARCAYADTGSELRDGSAWVPENSRRARAFVLHAALRALGRDGVSAMVERGVALAQRLAAQCAALPHASVLNDVVLNQVLLGFTPPGESDLAAWHAAAAGRIQREGACWIGASSWRGRPVLRVSISNWSTSRDDIDAAVAAIARATRA